MTRINTGINSVGLSFLIFITFAWFQGASSETNEVAQRREASSAFAPYWYVDEFTDSFIEIKNHLATQLTLVPVLTLASGRSIKLDALTIPASATKRLSLKSQPALVIRGKTGEGHWGDGSRPNSLAGNARLIPVYPKSFAAKAFKAFSAWILVENPTERLGVVSMFEDPGNTTSSVLEGLWWVPYPDTRAYYAVQNASAAPLDLNMQIYVDGKVVKQRVLSLNAFAFQLINIADELKPDRPPELGGIKFASATKGDRPYGDRPSVARVVARGVLIQERHGFSVSYMLHNPLSFVPKDNSSELQAPAVYFGRLAKLSGRSKAYVHPHLLLRNTANYRIIANATLSGRDGKGGYTESAIEPVVLEPQSVVHIDLEEQRQKTKSDLADGVAGLRLTYDGHPTDLVADLLNNDRTGDFTLYDDVRDLFVHHARVQVAISFNLASNGQSFLIVKNTTDKSQKVHIQLDYDEGRGHYAVKLAEVPPQQVEVVDIRHLRDAEIKDEDGQVLPPNAEFGGAVVLGELGAFVASDPSFIYSTATLDPDDFDPDDVGDDDRPHFAPTCPVDPVVTGGGGGGGGGGIWTGSAKPQLTAVLTMLLKLRYFVRGSLACEVTVEPIGVRGMKDGRPERRGENIPCSRAIITAVPERGLASWQCPSSEFLGQVAE